MGWQLGLERMHGLTTALGMPQHRFASVHVVGTNGKSSVTQTTAAMLEAHRSARRRLRFASCRALVASGRWSYGEEIEEAGFVRARSSGWRGRPRAWTAASTRARRSPSSRRRPRRPSSRWRPPGGGGVVEAGLGGRLDATNTIPSRGHRADLGRARPHGWLGETEVKIAAEKLAVLRDRSTLVLGQVSAGGRGAGRGDAPSAVRGWCGAGEGPGWSTLPRPDFQRRNFGVAMRRGRGVARELDPDRGAAVAAEHHDPGPPRAIADEPPIFLDAAHNPDGAAALAEALPAVTAGANGRLPGDPRRQGRGGDGAGAGAGVGPGRLHRAAGRGIAGSGRPDAGSTRPPSWRRRARRRASRPRRSRDFDAALGARPRARRRAPRRRPFS